MATDSLVLFNRVDALLKALSDREVASFEKRKRAFVNRNMALGGSSDGFRYMGLVYTDLEPQMRKMGKYDRLHPSLAPELEAILAEEKTFKFDMERIKQAFALVLRDCRSFQDMRDALPNCMKDLIPEIARLERTRPEAFTLAENERSYKQYMKLREKIEFYVASRLLF